MSLRVWLPLDGDLKQQGASDIVATAASHATVASAGKIGKCYNLDGSTAAYIELSKAPLSNDTEEFSYACWFYPANTTTSMCLYSNRTESNSNGISIFVFNSGSILYDAGDRWSQSTSLIPATTWTHLVFTYKKGVGRKIYINGVEKYSINTAPAPKIANATKAFIGASQSTSTVVNANFMNGKLNDVRIYDNCLSAAEVKEIAQGLVLHYKLDNNGLGGKNLLRNSNFIVEATNDTPASGVPASMPFTEDLQQLVGKTFTLSYEVYTPGARKNGVNGGSLNNRFGCHLTLKYTPSGGSQTTVYPCASYLTTTVNERNQRLVQTYTVPSNCTINSFGISVQPYAQPADDNDAVWRLGKIKLEYGNKATSYSPALEDYGWPNDIIEDSSGYGHHGSTLNEVEIASDPARYESCTHLVAGNSMINCGRGGMVTDSITVNIWIKASGWNNPVSCTEGGGWNFEANNGYFRFPVYIQSVGYKYMNTTKHTTAQIANNQWHMLTGVYDRLGQKIHVYVDGEIDSTADTGSSNPIAYHASNVIWIGGEATGSATAGSNGMAGYFSDFRIYATALSADDILELYHTSAKIDNLGGVHTFELVEGEGEHITKQGLIETDGIYENGYQSILQYDKNIYTEPDGSTWVHVFHHNNPSGGRFTNSTADWSNGVYIDENRWYDVEKMFYNLVKYEFMVKQKTTSDATENKWRWVQNINPMDATWATVGTDACVYNTSSGYATSNYKKGMYIFKTSDLHMCIANNTNGNWYGGIGAAAAFNGGIPGYPNTTVTTGYIDLYVRVYLPAKIIQNTGFSALEFIEK
jgi:hypothetical protein